MSAKYVVESIRSYAAKDGAEPREHVAYWYGPDHGFGTTSGPLDDYSTKIFTSRDHADRALRRVFGSVATARRQGYRIKRWDLAVIEEKNRRAARAAATQPTEPTKETR